MVTQLTPINKVVEELQERRSIAMQTIMLSLHKESRYKQYKLLCSKLTLNQVEELANQLKES